MNLLSVTSLAARTSMNALLPTATVSRSVLTLVRMKNALFKEIDTPLNWIPCDHTLEWSWLRLLVYKVLGSMCPVTCVYGWITVHAVCYFATTRSSLLAHLVMTLLLSCVCFGSVPGYQCSCRQDYLVDSSNNHSCVVNPCSQANCSQTCTLQSGQWWTPPMSYFYVYGENCYLLCLTGK